MRAGVYKKPTIVFKGERQLREEFAVGGVEVRTGPVDRICSDRIHVCGANGNRGVVITEQRDSAALDLAHDGIDGEGGVSAIADIVAHKNETADSTLARVVETGLEGLPI